MTDILWTSADVAEATGAVAAAVELRASGVSIDTRTLRPGDIFVALKGENHDGHDYVEKALENGAAAAIVSVSQYQLSTINHQRLLPVPDTLRALQDIARFARKRSQARFIGVTGSVGKTSVKEMIRCALASSGKVHANTGNLNNHIGLPLTLANLPPDANFCVCEAGMNHAGEIAELAGILQPHIAVITSVEAVHLEFFPSVAAIAGAKAEIFSAPELPETAILPRGNPYFSQLRAAAKKRGVKNILDFGEHPESDFRLLDYRDGEIKASLQGKEMNYQLQLSGRHQAVNSLAALAAAYACGVDLTEAAKALETLQPGAGRGRKYRLTLPQGAVSLIDDSYNAGPASMRAALAELARLKGKHGGRAVAALGDMRELGEGAPEFHAALAKDILALDIDCVFTAGALMIHLYDALPERIRGGRVDTAMEMMPVLRGKLQAGDLLLIKGSHGSDMWKLAAALRKEIPDVISPARSAG